MRCSRVKSEIVAYSQNRCEQSLRIAIAEHLTQCSRCRQTLTELEVTSSCLRLGFKELNPDASVVYAVMAKLPSRKRSSLDTVLRQLGELSLLFGPFPRKVFASLTIVVVVTGAVYLRHINHGLADTVLADSFSREASLYQDIPWTTYLTDVSQDRPYKVMDYMLTNQTLDRSDNADKMTVKSPRRVRHRVIYSEGFDRVESVVSTESIAAL